MQSEGTNHEPDGRTLTLDARGNPDFPDHVTLLGLEGGEEGGNRGKGERDLAAREDHKAGFAVCLAADAVDAGEVREGLAPAVGAV
jgi:hypothetical protein